MITAKELENQLGQFIGAERYYRLPLPKLIYTEGVKFFAEKAGCHWLLVWI